MVERLRFAVDHIRLAIRDRFAVAYTAPDLTHHQTNSGYDALGCAILEKL
jgi:hypothetical protein